MTPPDDWIKYVGVYGAIIATASLLWNIYNARSQNRIAIKVKAFPSVSIARLARTNEITSYSFWLSTAITNVGTRSVSFGTILIKGVNGILGRTVAVREFALHGTRFEYVKEVDGRKSRTTFFEYNDIKEFLENLRCRHLIVVLRDQTGKEFRSSRIPTKKIREKCELAKQQNAYLVERKNRQQATIPD